MHSCTRYVGCTKFNRFELVQRHLVAAIGTETGWIEGELEKLICYCGGPDKPITLAAANSDNAMIASATMTSSKVKPAWRKRFTRVYSSVSANLTSPRRLLSIITDWSSVLRTIRNSNGVMSPLEK